MFIDEVIVDNILDYPETFRLVIEGFPNTSVQFYIGRIDYKIYLVQNHTIEYHDNKNDQPVCRCNDMDFVHNVI